MDSSEDCSPLAWLDVAGDDDGIDKQCWAAVTLISLRVALMALKFSAVKAMMLALIPNVMILRS